MSQKMLRLGLGFLLLLIGAIPSPPAFGQAHTIPDCNNTSCFTAANPGAVSLSSGSATIGTVAIDQTTPGTTNGVRLNTGANIVGQVGIDQTTQGTTNGVRLNTGSNIVGQFGIDQTTPGTTNGVRLNTGSNIAGQFGIDQTTPGTTDSVSVKSQAYSAAVTLTRTNDTNAYTANDVIGAATGSTAALTFASMGPSGKEIVITSAALEIDITAVVSGMTSFRLYLYNVTPPSALGDNAAFDLPSGDRASYLGYVDLGTPVDLGSTLYVESNGIQKQVKLSGTSLFGYLVTNGAWTPAASTVFVITLHSVAP